MCDVVVKKFTFAISSPDEFLYLPLYGVPVTSLGLESGLRDSDSDEDCILRGLESIT